MPASSRSADDQRYMDVLLGPLRVCARYKPAFGQVGQNGTSLLEFRALYGADTFYRWIGLDSDLMYAAHKAAGGMTSVYRQLGAGCERLFRAIASDRMGLSPEQLSWSYEVKGSDGKVAKLTLDGRLDVEHLPDDGRRKRVRDWVAAAAQDLGIKAGRRRSFRGAVFEVRQGYKSADAKRQNADLRSALRAMNDNYLFVLAVFSAQINYAVLRRYRNAQILVLVGGKSGSATESTFTFFDELLGYSLVSFLERNSAVIREEVEAILKQLLSPS